MSKIKNTRKKIQRTSSTRRTSINGRKKKAGKIKKLTQSPNNKQTSNYKQGLYIPKYPDKYMGDVNNIIFRSSWELEVFDFCDNNPNIICWSSEEIKIPYIKPTFDGRGAKHAFYYPDIYVEYYNSNGAVIKEIIEIKPYKQTIPTRARTQKNRLYESKIYAVNQEKWKYAKIWCMERGIRFNLMTEKDIFMLKNK
jgi:hypothetical protein